MYILFHHDLSPFRCFWENPTIERDRELFNVFYSTCRREVILENVFDYVLDPYSLWLAKEGNLWDAVLASVEVGEGWLREVSLPADPTRADAKRYPWIEAHGDDREHPKVRRCPEDGKLRVEIFPGIWVRGRIDRLSTDFKHLIDHKTKKMVFK